MVFTMNSFVITRRKLLFQEQSIFTGVAERRSSFPITA